VKGKGQGAGSELNCVSARKNLEDSKPQNTKVAKEAEEA